MFWSRLFPRFTNKLKTPYRNRGRHFAPKKNHHLVPKSTPTTNIEPVSKAETVINDATMLIIYKDDHNHPLADPELIAGQLGTSFNLNFKEFKYYRLVKIQGFTSTFVDEYGIITLTYQKISAANVWVFCIDLDQHRFLMKPSFVNGRIAEEYELASPSIKGYRLLLAQGPFRGKFTAKQQIVTFFYRQKTIKTIKQQPYFLKMKAFVTCYDNPKGQATKVTLAKGTIWQTFQTINYTDGQIWHCMGGNIWIKETPNAFVKLTRPPQRNEISYQSAIKLPYSTTLDDVPAEINFVPHKQVTSYTRPFGQPATTFIHGQKVILTAFVSVSQMDWYQINHQTWLNRQYLKFL